MRKQFVEATVYSADMHGRVITARVNNGQYLDFRERLNNCEELILPNRNDLVGRKCFIACRQAENGKIYVLPRLCETDGEIYEAELLSEGEARLRALKDSVVFMVNLTVDEIVDYASVQDDASHNEVYNDPDLLAKLREPFEEGDAPASFTAWKGIDEASLYAFDQAANNSEKPKP